VVRGAVLDHLAGLSSSPHSIDAIERNRGAQPQPWSIHESHKSEELFEAGEERTVTRGVATARKREDDKSAGSSASSSESDATRGRYHVFPLELLLPLRLRPRKSVCWRQRTTPLDTTDQDLLFRKNKAPASHWDALKVQQRARAQRAVEGAHMVTHDFRRDTYLALVEEDCKRIRSGVIRKSQQKAKSIWEIAAETALNTHNELADRRQD
jgi:hypothetical protein